MTTTMSALFLAIAAPLLAAPAGASPATDATPYLDAVRVFADNVLKHGRDVYGPRHTPLLIDGVNIDTHEPATWVLPDDCAAVWKMPKRIVMCNVASQQNLFRVLDALTTLTGDAHYRRTAEEAMRYTLAHLQHHDGLLYWGGHTLLDANTDQIVGESHKDWTRGVPIPAYWEIGTAHELKHHFPYYELMWQIDPKATEHFIEGFWAAHIQNWANLDMNRHGYYGMNAGTGWDHEYVGGPLPFAGKGLSILHGGSDLMYAAGMLYSYTGDERPLVWARRMAQRYADIRHPTTRLGPDAYNYYHNERILAQFGPEFGDRVTEMTITSVYGSRYGDGALALMKLSERLGSAGDAFKQLAIEDLKAYAKSAYDPQDNSFWFTLTDGTRLTPDDWKRPGPLRQQDLAKRRAGSTHFWCYSEAFKLDRDPALWAMVRRIGQDLDLGETPKVEPRINPRTTCADTNVLFALLELCKAAGHDAFLDLARRVGDNLLAREFYRGWFVPSHEHLYVKFDTVTPLALLYLHVALNHGDMASLPFYLGGNSYFHCDYEGKGRTYDGAEIWSLRRTSPARAPATAPSAAK